MNLVAAMIVKNEAAVLNRCFDSLLPHVSRIIVNDNGSTDNTPGIIESYGDRAVMVPGEWVNFSVNRNLALRVAREWGDYIFCGIDADEMLVGAGVQEFITAHPADAYTVDIHLGPLVYKRTAIVRSTFPWEWRYPVQEGLYHTSHVTPVILHIPEVYILSHRDGARANDPNTQTRDLDMLMNALEKTPDDPRLVFYVAQQLKDMQQLSAAKQMYSNRFGMLHGWDEERWYSQFMMARITDWEGGDPTAGYLAAFDANPTRAEPLFYAADWYRRHGKNALAFVAASAGALLEQPVDALFVERDVYEWRMFDVLSVCAYYTPFARIGKEATITLLVEKKFPESEGLRINKNFEHYARI